jgi:hypothetical protein
MKNLFAILAVSALLVSCGESKKCESTCDSTKTCCKDSTVIVTDSAVVDSDTTAVKDTVK